MALDFDASILGREYDLTNHEAVTQQAIDNYVASCGEPADAPGVAPPMFVLSLRMTHLFPRNMPNLGGTGFDAGKDIQLGVAIRVGDSLLSRSTVHDIFEKTGRSGTMAFMVLRTVVTNQRQEQVAVIDQRMMFR